MDFECATVGPTGGDDAAAINAAFVSAPAVRVVGTLNLRSTITVPPYKALFAESRQTLTKQFDGPMCVLGEWASTSLLRWEGAGGSFDGAGILCVANSTGQTIENTWVLQTRGACVDMSATAAGSYCTITGGLYQRYDRTLAAIVLPADEPGTIGVRRILGVSARGYKLIDLAGSNVTQMHYCDTYRLDMSARCRYLVATGNRFAIPAGEVLNIRGSNHRFGFNTTSQQVHFTADALGCLYQSSNYDAGVVLQPGTQSNQIGHMLLVPAPVNTSGNATNAIEVTASF